MFFEVGSYKVHIYSWSVLYRNPRSVQPQCGAAESRSSPDAQRCTAVNGVQRKREIKHLKQGSPQKIYNSSSVRCKGKIHTALHRHQPFHLALHFLNQRTSVSLRWNPNRRSASSSTVQGPVVLMRRDIYSPFYHEGLTTSQCGWEWWLSRHGEVSNATFIELLILIHNGNRIASNRTKSFCF